MREIASLERTPKFRAAFDFLVLREAYEDSELAEPTNGMGEWWQAYQDANAAQKAQMIELFSTQSGVPKRRRRDRLAAVGELNLELEQLRELSLRQDTPKTKPKPLFVVEGYAGKDKEPAELTTPVFETVDYSDEDFAKLLANDEPYIPSRRHRRRQPSSTLSILERQAGMIEESKPAKARKTKAKTADTTKQADKKAAKSAKSGQTADSDAKPKRRRSRKSNAKPKADDFA